MIRFASKSRERKGSIKTKAEDQLTPPKDRPWCLDDFTFGPVLGTGSFGRVALATEKRSGGRCAIKTLSKAHILKNQQIGHIKAEKDTLKHVDHPCIVRLFGAFQDLECVYLVMEFVSGGEFFTHLKAVSKLPEDTAKFYAAQVMTVFEYLHSQNIIYRDLKPENLLLTAAGHLKVTDFGFAKFVAPTKRTYTLCGTPDYLAPEIILNKGHGKAVDWWAFGVLIYEMLAGYPPFYEEDTAQTYQRILHGRFTFPNDFPVTARDLVRKLLQTDLSKRYGCLAAGVNDIRSHPWFRSIDWSALNSGVTEPPIKPANKAGDSSNFETYNLPPLKHLFQLTQEDQVLFEGM